jgi:hypothetical protein
VLAGAAKVEGSVETFAHNAQRMRPGKRTTQAATTLALRRGELIETELAARQATYLLVALSQNILAIPQTHSRRLLGINDAKEMNAKLKEMSLSMLEELSHLPEQITDPNWLRTLKRDDSEKPPNVPKEKMSNLSM